MEHLIIGTAGHIDHGKTALIRALTGRDPDRLKEEKERGITTDLGFTWFDLPDGRRAGVIDVPGHEKFLPNMLAGVWGMDLVLLVIALDEGIMPQTREHMDILSFLDVPGGIVVLTKADMVEPEWADMMEEEIAQGLAGTMFSGWPRLRVSAVTGQRIDKLKEQIVRTEKELTRNRSVSGRFRLPIDRVISFRGLGLVAAGTVAEGMAFPDQELMISPTGQKTRVRGIQIHGEDAERAEAGQRAALLLKGVSKEDLKRGYALVDSESPEAALRLDVRLSMVKGTSRVLKNQSRVHLHAGPAAVLCRVVLLEQDALAAGETGYAQLVLEEPLAVKEKDPFVIRFYSPLETIGGGRILDAHPVRHKRHDEQVMEYLKNRENDRRGPMLLSQLSGAAGRPLGMGELAERTGFSREEIRPAAEELAEGGECLLLTGKKECFVWLWAEAEQEAHRLEQFLADYHRRRPCRRGIEKALLKSSLCRAWEPAKFDAWLGYLAAHGGSRKPDRTAEDSEMEGNSRTVSEAAEAEKIDGSALKSADVKEKETDVEGVVLPVEQTRQETGRIRIADGLVALADFEPELDAAGEALKRQLTETFAAAGFDFRKASELRPESMDETNYQELLAFLTEKGEFAAISDEFYTTAALAEEMENRVKAYFRENEFLSFGSLRDLLGSSRRSAKPAMAYLDRRKVTAWCGKETERKAYV